MSLYKGDTYISGSLAIDSALSPTSTNAVQNKVVDAAIKAVLPSGGVSGQILQKTAAGEAWANQYPSGGYMGDFLRRTSDGGAYWGYLDEVPTWKPTTTYVNGALTIHPDRAYIMSARVIGAGSFGQSEEILEGLDANVPSGTVLPDSDTLEWVIYNIEDIYTGMASKQSKITSGTAEPTGGSDGDVYIQYEA